MEFVLFFGIAALVLIVAVYGYLQAQKRKGELIAWAESRGLSYSPVNDYSFDERFANHSCLCQGSARYAYNIMEGRIDTRVVCAFDYHYETHSTDSKGNQETSHHHFSAVVVESEVPLKPLFIRREGFFDKIGAFLGFDDIDFESAEFSREFCVKAPDKRWAFDVLHQRAMEFLLASPRFTLDFQPDGVLVTGSGCFQPTQFDDAVRVVNGLLDMLPHSVVQELKEAEG